jgi:surface carbohydrate biosynthesis protein
MAAPHRIGAELMDGIGTGRRPRVALIVDHPQRDLDGLVLVAAHLARAGADALLVPMYQKHEAQLLGADVIVVNYVRAANLPFLRSSRRLGLPTVVLDTEGGVVSDKTSYAERISTYLEYADLYLVWGEALVRHSSRSRRRAASRSR